MRSRIAKGLAWLACSAAGFIPAAAGMARMVEPGQAPAAWLHYAEQATLGVKGWLQADSEAALRVRAHLDGMRGAPDQATPALPLKLWIDREGVISRIDFPPFEQAQVNDDLKSLLIGRHLAARPPKGMLLPLRIAIEMDGPKD